jgi:hypothetical protein
LFLAFLTSVGSIARIVVVVSALLVTASLVTASLVTAALVSALLVLVLHSFVAALVSALLVSALLVSAALGLAYYCNHHVLCPAIIIERAVDSTFDTWSFLFVDMITLPCLDICLFVCSFVCSIVLSFAFIFFIKNHFNFFYHSIFKLK